MPQINMYAEHAKDILQPPSGWEAYRFEAIGGIEAKLIEVTGAVAPLKTKGKDKGLPNWKQMDKSTQKTAYFTPQEHEAWTKEWEQKTGRCSACGGDGKELARWSATEGATYRQCKKCNGDGMSEQNRASGQCSQLAISQPEAQASLW